MISRKLKICRKSGYCEFQVLFQGLSAVIKGFSRQCFNLKYFCDLCEAWHSHTQLSNKTRGFGGVCTFIYCHPLCLSRQGSDKTQCPRLRHQYIWNVGLARVFLGCNYKVCQKMRVQMPEALLKINMDNFHSEQNKKFPWRKK